MKNLRMLHAALAIAAVSMVVGCSDQITSSGETGSSKKDEGVIEQTSERRLPANPTFKVQIILKGNARYDLNKFSTGFDKLFSIDITNLSSDKGIPDCSEISVYNDGTDKSIGCQSSGFEYNSLIIENTGSSNKKLDITVTGWKFVKQQDVKAID